jgi:hypothetical protein
MVQSATAKAPENVVTESKTRGAQPLMTDDSLGAAAMGAGPTSLQVIHSHTRPCFYCDQSDLALPEQSHARNGRFEHERSQRSIELPLDCPDISDHSLQIDLSSPQARYACA